jgi:hypothetical protein
MKKQHLTIIENDQQDLEQIISKGEQAARIYRQNEQCVHRQNGTGAGLVQAGLRYSLAVHMF